MGASCRDSAVFPGAAEAPARRLPRRSPSSRSGAHPPGGPSMYYLAIRQFMRSLKNLDDIMGKAQKYAETRGFSADNFCNARIFPDMLPFNAQIRIACDSAKAAAANLSSKAAPTHEDNETTFAELRGRIAKCLGYLETLSAKDFERTQADQPVKMPDRPNRPGKTLRAQEYLVARQIPNFYFHVVTAYDILRQGGVEIGKSDYLGALEYLEG
ncbi:MAG TPA: DUF1993 domain-containing protein [Polyangia bacterium]|nr:DUF1993 domain-containing protein [Polyangia bacterium]